MMYPREFAASFSGLSDRQIRQLEKDGIIKPQTISGMKYYSYTDIYVLRVVRILKREGISLAKIRNAYDCLMNLKPDMDLSQFILFHDGKEVFDLTDDPAIIASRYGQIASKDLLAQTLKPVAIGSELELTRRKIVGYKQELHRRRQEVKEQDEYFTIEDIEKLMSA